MTARIIPNHVADACLCTWHVDDDGALHRQTRPVIGWRVPEDPDDVPLPIAPGWQLSDSEVWAVFAIVDGIRTCIFEGTLTVIERTADAEAASLLELEDRCRGRVHVPAGSAP